MTRLRLRWRPLAVLVAATTALIASIVWASTSSPSGPVNWGQFGGMGGMTGGVSDPGTGPVQDLAAAERVADDYGQRWGLRVGEVMQFSNGFYAELVDSSGQGATEVLIDESTGSVGIEYGPAMMWNTRYGMMGGGMMGGSRGWSCDGTPDQAQKIADTWLQGNKAGLHAGEADTFPGYYTLHTMRGDQIIGMLSVHCGSGAVWYHSWHGQFVDMQKEHR